MRRTLSASFIAATLAGFIAPTSAMAVTMANAQVGKLCEVQAVPNYFIDQLGNTPSTSEQSTACNLTASGSDSYGQPTYAHADGYASAGFGTLPNVAITSAGASTASTNARAEASLMAATQFFVEIQPIGTPPGAAPALIPIRLSARGAGYAEASNDRSLVTTIGTVDMYGWQLPTSTEFGFEYRNVTDGRQDWSFNGSVPLAMYPWREYSVIVNSACSSVSLGYAAGSTGGCSSWVDPSFAFDQAAFDQQMGNGSFALADYYQFAFSPNVPVPEPEAYALMLAGLGLVGFAARRRKPH